MPVDGSLQLQRNTEDNVTGSILEPLVDWQKQSGFEKKDQSAKCATTIVSLIRLFNRKVRAHLIEPYFLTRLVSR
jgi:hypothetical protein